MSDLVPVEHNHVLVKLDQARLALAEACVQADVIDFYPGD
jgi:hypothetical protein